MIVVSVFLAPVPIAQASVIQLVVAPDRLSGYDRSFFKLWIDADKNGCNTRKEVLIQEAIVEPKKGAKCVLTGGKWISPYDEVTYTNDSSLDIDHLVPLAEAWRSGAWAWSALQRQNFANDLAEPKALVAVSLRLNRQKGDRDPSTWLPPKDQCGYISNWITVKFKYSLTVDSIEANTLSAAVTQCGFTNVEIGIPTPTAATTTTTTSTTSTTVAPTATTTTTTTSTTSTTVAPTAATTDTTTSRTPSSSVDSSSNTGLCYVRGYVTKRGTVVSGYYRRCR